METLFFGADLKLEQLSILDWGKMPYTQGAYSFASPKADNHRKALAESIDGKLFFAGEATHTGGHAATVHGAMETAERVVNEIQ